MARPGGLGRGLSSLIPSDPIASASSTYRELLLDAIEVNQYQPRKHFDEEALQTLAASVKEFGVLQPIVVRELGPGRYELVAGERRWRASRQAGLATVPAVVRDIGDEASLVQAVVENIHREDLNPLEEAAAFQQLIEDFGVTHEELGSRLGKGRTTITNTLRLLQLPVAVQVALVDGAISAGHARALLTCQDQAVQETIVQQIIAEGLSVRAVERLVREMQSAAPVVPDEDEPAPEPGETRPAAVLEVENLLGEQLSTRVRVQMGTKRGKLSIDFADFQDLQRIFEMINTV